MRFHHVGYAVRDLQAYLDGFAMPLFQPLAVSAVFEDPIQHVRVCFLTMQGGTLLELVEPFGAGSPVESVLAAGRGGLYHLCYEVENIETELVRFRASGCLPLGKPAPAVAFEGRRIVFLLTPQRDIIEFVEAPD